MELVNKAEAAKATGSWVLIIRHLCQQRSFERAVQIYKDLSLPNEFLASSVLRGLGEEPVDRFQVDRALEIYHSIESPDSRFERNIVINNAMMTICARAKDLKTLWQVFSTLPKIGKNAANEVTYDTMLRALRNDLTWYSRKFGPTYEEKVKQNVSHGRAIWQQARSKWLSGTLANIERVAGAYLLLMVVPPNLDRNVALHILEVVEEIAGIPIDVRKPIIQTASARPYRGTDDLSYRRSNISNSSGKLRRSIEGDQLLGTVLHAHATLLPQLPEHTRSAAAYYHAFTVEHGVQPSAWTLEAYAQVAIRTADSDLALVIAQAVHELREAAPVRHRPAIRAALRCTIIACLTAIKSERVVKKTSGGSFLPNNECGPLALQHADQILTLVDQSDALANTQIWYYYLQCAIEGGHLSQIQSVLQRLRPHISVLQEQLDITFPPSDGERYPVRLDDRLPYAAPTAIHFLKYVVATTRIVTDENLGAKLQEQETRDSIASLLIWGNKLVEWLVVRGVPPVSSFIGNGQLDHGKLDGDNGATILSGFDEDLGRPRGHKIAWQRCNELRQRLGLET
ncbi:PPR repeat family-like protein 2 [Elsinoe australis]|uniref:PPR repeat family-like protein 2 n=1 Tax=Elsinoe australis TaxID=40998 RepID=A0A4U7AM71_9PEZI|nr:PPR repeat family-like protein 2 [Elsinoe australis]